MHRSSCTQSTLKHLSLCAASLRPMNGRKSFREVFPNSFIGDPNMLSIGLRRTAAEGTSGGPCSGRSLALREALLVNAPALASVRSPLNCSAGVLDERPGT